jgi:predicted GNAT family N-acyltransferase
LSPKLAIPDGYSLERLDTARHSRAEFSCGKPPLDEFLRTQASQAQGKYVSSTHVLVVANQKVAEGKLIPIVGYLTMVSAEIPLTEIPASLKMVTNKIRLPALLLARMAVDTAHKGKDLGEFLLKRAFLAAHEMNQASGCFTLFVDAKDQDSKSFYIKYGFTPFADQPMRLFFPMFKIEKLFQPV